MCHQIDDNDDDDDDEKKSMLPTEHSCVNDEDYVYFLDVSSVYIHVYISCNCFHLRLFDTRIKCVLK